MVNDEGGSGRVEFGLGGDWSFADLSHVRQMSGSHGGLRLAWVVGIGSAWFLRAGGGRFWVVQPSCFLDLVSIYSRFIFYICFLFILV